METDSTAQDTSNLMEIIIKHNKDEHKIKISPKATLNVLRKSIQDVTQILPGLQKLMFKGILKGEDKTLEELGVKPNTRIMVVGSSLHEVMSLSAVPSGEEKKRLEEEPANTNPLSEQLPHKKIIDKGVPEGADQGYKGRNDPLPQNGLQSLLNNRGTKVRLSFKVFAGELWISSATDTQKIMFAQIKSIHSEPIKGNEDYHLMSLQLGASETSRYFLYFVPAQYVKAIKDTIMF
jgi:predicted small metal-binding protein